MASIVNTVKHSMLEYPTIAPTVESVLHHLFCVNGNGYDWEGGELVSYPPVTVPIDVKALAKRNRADLRKQAKLANETFKRCGVNDSSLALYYKRELCLYDFTVKHIDDVVSDFTVCSPNMDGYNLYPLCRYAKLLNVPEDVKDDWLWALYHFTQALQGHFFRKYDGRKPSMREDKVYYDALPDLLVKFESMLVARQLLLPREEREALATRVINQIITEERDE